jgi:hypothetical protein
MTREAVSGECCKQLLWLKVNVSVERKVCVVGREGMVYRSQGWVCAQRRSQSKSAAYSGLLTPQV